MEIQIAETLIDGLREHSGLIPIDTKLFLDILAVTGVPESSGFYETLPDTKQSLQESDRLHYLSLRRVLRNRNAESCRLSGLKRLVGSTISNFGVYSSDHLTRSLRANRDLVKIMAGCREPFSLLGKFETYDFGDSDSGLFVVTKPILVIPGVENAELINGWEEENTRYEKEAGVFFRRQKRVSPQEYFAH